MNWIHPLSGGLAALLAGAVVAQAQGTPQSPGNVLPPSNGSIEVPAMMGAPTVPTSQPRGASFGSQRFRMTLAGVSERRECGLMRTRSCYRQRLKAEMQGCASVTLIWLIHSGAEAAQRFCMVMQAIDDHVEVWRFAASGDGGGSVPRLRFHCR